MTLAARCRATPRLFLIATVVACALFTFLPSRGIVSVTAVLLKKAQISPSGHRPRAPEPEAPEPAKSVPPGTWGLCVAVDPTSTHDTEALNDTRAAAGKLAVPARVLVSLREGGTVAGFPPEDVLKPSAAIGVATAFTACTARAAAFAGLVFCEARNCTSVSLDATVKESVRQMGIAMNKRHTVFAAVSRVVATLGVFEENLFPAIDGLAVDYAIRWHLTMQHRLPKDLMRKVRRIAHRRKARTMHHLLAKSGHRSSDLSVVDATRRDRCNAGNVLATKYMSNGMNLVNGDGRLALIQVPLPIDTTFRSCVRSGDGVRRHLCGQRRHCVFDGNRGLAATEKKLHVELRDRANHTMWFGWQHVLAARIGFLLKLAQDQPWREDIVHGVVMTVTPKDIAAMKDTVLTYDAPIKMFTILLSGHSERLAQDLRSVANMVDQDGVGDKFRFFYEAGGVRDIDGWNGQTQHIFREDPTSQWVWVTEPTVSLWPSYLACFAKDTTSVQYTHSYSRLHVRPQSMAIMRSSSDRLAAITKAPNSVSELDRGLCAVCRWDHCVVDPEESPRADCDAADVPVRGGGWTSDLPCCHAHHLYRSD